MLEPFVLLPSKLAPPRISVALLRRAHLLDVLHRGLERRLVLLTAEAGYGKTSLLISALDGIARPVAWLTLDERDTDPSLFGAGLVLALRRVAPRIGRRALEALAGGPCARITEATLLGCLDELPGDTVVVLDDFHVLDDTPAAQALADSLLTHLPPHVHVAIAPALGPSCTVCPDCSCKGKRRCWTVRVWPSRSTRRPISSARPMVSTSVTRGSGPPPSARRDGRRRRPCSRRQYRVVDRPRSKELRAKCSNTSPPSCWRICRALASFHPGFTGASHHRPR